MALSDPLIHPQSPVVRAFIWLGDALGAIAIAVGVILVAAESERPTRVISFHPVTQQFSKAALLNEAGAIVVARFDRVASMKWNSLDGREWKSDNLARPAYIYRDDRMNVIRQIPGNVGSDFITRSVGGEVADVVMTFDGQPTWRSGRDYLLFLRQEQTPLSEGFEERWTVLWMEQGVFEPGPEGGWVNLTTGLSFTPQEFGLGG